MAKNEEKETRCHICGGRHAVINIRQIIGSDVKDISLCKTCAEERGILGKDNKIELSMDKILGGLLFPEKPVKKPLPESLNCPVCGMKAQDISKEGRIGCTGCVNAFHGEIQKYLSRKDLEFTHQGKLPKNLQTVKTLLFDREELKAELQRALDGEDYEAAARLRDRIKSLEEAIGVVHD